MKLNVIHLGAALAAIWALAALSAGVVNLLSPGYGVEFLKLVDSIYPGYHLGKWGFGGVLVATLYAAIDGFVCGVIIAWVYNLCGKCLKKEKE